MQDRATPPSFVPVERLPVTPAGLAPETLQALRAAANAYEPFDPFKWPDSLDIRWDDPSEWVWTPVTPSAYDYDEVVQPLVDALLAASTEVIPDLPSIEVVIPVPFVTPSVVVLGATASGKTETINKLLAFFRTEG